MTSYIIEVPEVHYQQVRVEADSPEEALAKVREGDGDYLEAEYSHILDFDLSKVHEEGS
jgi:hypothetical protein